MVRLVVKSMVTLTLVMVGAGMALGCGTDDQGPGGTTTSTTSGELPVLSIEQALSAEAGSTIRVRGALLVTGVGSETEMVLVSALAESYPPQAGGPTLVLEGFELDELVGLNSTEDRADAAGVTWSDYWFVVEGTIADGALQVKTLPEVVSAEVDGIVVRFSAVGDPYASGETAWWALDIKNAGDVAIRLVFSSGQQGDVVLYQDGAEKYRWSDGKAFTQAIEEVTIQPGAKWSAVLNDVLPVEPGDYALTASVSAALADGPDAEGAGRSLPELSTSITVR